MIINRDPDNKRGLGRRVEKSASRTGTPRMLHWLDESANRAIHVRFPINDRAHRAADDLIKARTEIPRVPRIIGLSVCAQRLILSGLPLARARVRHTDAYL